MSENAVDEKECREALSKVVDPELQLDIVSLGLIYKLEIKGLEVELDMTMTSPGCPLAAEIIISARNELLKVKGIEKADIHLVWSPPWTPEMMTDDAKAVLGMI